MMWTSKFTERIAVIFLFLYFQQSRMYTYKVIFFTGSLSWSGTNANIDLTLYGTEGESQMLLFKNRGNTTFESGM